MIRKIYVFISILLLGTVGCTQAPILKVYDLDTISNIKRFKHTTYSHKTIKVSCPKNLKEPISQKMRFSYSSSQRGVYQNSQWSNNINRLLQGTFIEVLEKAKLFRTVLLDTSTVREDYRLESTIFALEHRVRGTSSYAILSVQFTLIDTDIGKLVKSKRFSYREATQTIDAKGYVKATNKALDRLSKDLLHWLKSN